MADPWAFMIPRPGEYQERPKTWTERNLDPLAQALLGRSTGQAVREADRNLSYLARALLDGAKLGAETFGPQADVKDITEGARSMGQGVAGMDWRKLLEGATQTAGGALGLLTPGSFGAAQAIFAGPGAKNANMGMLAKAEQLAAGGADARRIWDETGWFRGADGKWRFEIDDSAAYLERPAGAPSGYHKLMHDDLLEAYPDMNRVQQSITTGPEKGRYDPRFDAVVAQGPDYGSQRSVGLHEYQHAVQGREGFAAGDNPESHRSLYHAVRQTLAERLAVQEAQMIADIPGMPTPDEIEWVAAKSGLDARRLAQLSNEYQGDALQRSIEALRTQADDLDPNSIYRRAAGEVEARNVQTRRDWSPEQRRATPPWETEDIPRDKQIVRFR